MNETASLYYADLPAVHGNGYHLLLMIDEIQLLIDSLRRGQYEDPAEKIALLSAALQEHKADLPLLLRLIRAPQIPLRLAAMDASQGRTEPELIAELAGLAQNGEPRIRMKLAEILRLHTQTPATGALHTLIKDTDAAVRTAALRSSSGRPEFRAVQEKCLAGDSNWDVRLAAVDAMESQKSHEVVRALFNALHDDDSDVRRRSAEVIEKRLGQFPEATPKHLSGEISQLTRAEKQLKQLGADRFPKLIAWLTAKTTIQVDPADLARFGTDLTALALSKALPHAYYAEEGCESVLKFLERDPWREIQAVLQRSGIRRRQLSVDVDDSVVSLLVRVGYSPRFGARPLKRTVERLLLLPLARAISSGSLRGRTVLRLTEQDGRVHAVMTGSSSSKAAGADESGRPPEPLSKRFVELQESYDALETAVRTLADRKSELIIHTQEPGSSRMTTCARRHSLKSTTWTNS